ncbi:MAG: hypothetical protein J7623_07975 [Chitinophaga sp.]|uniref:hypothetical protein n=1 Tax=Chitinophaga sp. TaxID=1869181 RepID=UPI001B298CA8|nr:hypothetical protein [Chitinophaga sp.]MBO9728558.1 hypothetical protein [Chitinophaga sp.]
MLNRKFASKVCLVAAFSMIGALTVTAQPLVSKATVPARASAALTVYQQEFNYGYLEGQKYRQRNDYAGYQYMLNHYRSAWQMYPENGEFYRGRIDGLNAGWNNNVIDL